MNVHPHDNHKQRVYSPFVKANQYALVDRVDAIPAPSKSKRIGM